VWAEFNNGVAAALQAVQVTVSATRFMGKWDYRIPQVIEAQRPSKSQSGAAWDNGQELE
ncbi:unnamed protein product, partial [Effrenium voratum]